MEGNKNSEIKNNNSFGKLSEESIKRKQRLKKLREQHNSSKKDCNKNGEKLPLLPVFRSYKPQNADTIGKVLEQKPSGNIENAVASQLQLLKEPVLTCEIDIATLAPRKADWDLKRDVAKKLEFLERRTQKAIAELIRHRLEIGKSQTGQDIFQAVNVGTAHIDINNDS